MARRCAVATARRSRHSVVKKNLIEFQLDGGGFGTFWDDTNTNVTPYHVEKSSYEKQLERDINNTTDPQRRRDLQRELDRARDRRERDQRADDRAAAIASQLKVQQVAEKRLRGGSRFNLRWNGSIPQEQLTPDALIKLLDGYVDFADLQAEKAILEPVAQTPRRMRMFPPKARRRLQLHSSSAACKLARSANCWAWAGSFRSPLRKKD